MREAEGSRTLRRTNGACGSAGFLCEAFAYLIKLRKTARDRETLQKKMLFGKEKKALPFIIGTMNMILHGVEAPNILLTNTLAENLANIQLSQAAAAQPNVNAEKYGNMLVPIPPVHEQDEIVSCIGKTQGLILQLQQNYARQIADCAEMRQTILREAFEGRL